MTKWLYWLLVFALVGFGSVAIFSIGAPFLLLGFTLAVLGSFRTRPSVFWPSLAGVVGFITGYVLFAPLNCNSVSGGPGGAGHTTCSAGLGFHYSGGVSYNPPLWPAVLAGLFLAAGLAAAAVFLVRNRKQESTAWQADVPEEPRGEEG